MSPLTAYALSRRDIPVATRVRFIAKVAIAGAHDCWIWQGAKVGYGYGHFNLNGRTRAAHRIAYALWHSDIPAGITVDHLCGNPSCVNPSHLEAVPHKVNLLRGRTSACAANARKEHCPRGHEYAVYFHKSLGRSQRYCPTCKREKGREWMRRHRGSDPSRFRA